MKVVVAGAAGLIGSALLRELAADDRVAEVVGIDLAAGAPRAGKVRAIQRDIGEPAIREDLVGANAVIHLASRDHDLHATVDAALRAARNLFEAALDVGVGTIVYASSSAVYGSAPDNPVPMDERHPLRPAQFAYPQTKLAIEQLLEQLGTRHRGARLVRLRPSWVVGPGARMLLAGRAYVSLSDFDPQVQATWIGDAVAGFTAALHAPTASGAFNIGASRTVCASEIAGLLGVRAIRLPYHVRHAVAAATARLGLPGALPPGFVEMDRYPIVLDASKARSELGWSPRYNTREAFQLAGRGTER